MEELHLTTSGFYTPRQDKTTDPVSLQAEAKLADHKHTTIYQNKHQNMKTENELHVRCNILYFNISQFGCKAERFAKPISDIPGSCFG